MEDRNAKDWLIVQSWYGVIRWYSLIVLNY